MADAETATDPALTPVAPGEVVVRRALLSVSDKRGIVDFARGLSDLGVEIVSTGGTARELTGAGVPVRSISDFTGAPEIMGGRVKTLHPKLYGGLLARRDEPAHLREAAENGVEFVDLVCVNLYPFEATSARRGATDEEVVEDIDIGGPTMIRAAAKNHPFTAVVTSPEAYDGVLAELQDLGGRLSLPTRESLAATAFATTARYDTAISRWFAEKHDDFPDLLVRAFEKAADLPYGENPHQRAAFYTQVGARLHVLSMAEQKGGRDLSYNNILDLDAARAICAEFVVPACVIVKHNNPCGVALGEHALEAYERAVACDPLSAFGGIVVLNRPVDAALAERIASQFVEVLFAPGFDDEALEVLRRKEKMRILEDRERRAPSRTEVSLRQVIGGLLVQDRDADVQDRSEMEVVSARRPTEREWEELLFAWRVCKHVKSNAIVLGRELATVGIGAGQMSRVDSVRIALEKARSPLEGAVLASDAFFPFADGPQLALEAGITAVIQPGGSMRDPEVVEAIDAAGAAMVFTSRRHFRH